MKLTMTMTALAVLTVTIQIHAQSGTSSVPIFTPNLGAETFETAGVPVVPLIGYARLQPTTFGTSPVGTAVLDLRQSDGVLVNETSVPGTTTITAGRTFVEFNGTVNTGVAIANPSSLPVTMTF